MDTTTTPPTHPANGYDAVIVGAGPNGLAAAITLARAGRAVLVAEGAPTPGGGMRSAELTLPGFVHDVCATAHPLALSSPFLRSVPLDRYGVEWIASPAPLAHPLDDGTAIMLERSVEQTAAQFGRDAAAYRRLFEPLARDWLALAEILLGPLRPTRHLVTLALFGMHGILSARALLDLRFHDARLRALFAGLCAHSMLALDQPATAAFGLVLAAAGHSVGWPIVRGGSQRLADALVTYLHALGGVVHTGEFIGQLEQLPAARAILLDVTPRQLLAIAGDRLPCGYARQLRRYRYGMGVCKVDFALDGPIPWRAEGCARAATVHLGGTYAEIARAEQQVARGLPPERPFVLLAQQSLFDPTRAPPGGHSAWAYCHVPGGSAVDMTDRIVAQIERFAPGFRARIRARHTLTAQALERYNPNYIGGDINGGAPDLWQLFARPAPRLDPYAVPGTNLYLCSSATPPGGGVHGMCGDCAARAALRGRLRS